ncbi:class I SAM-dependent methyltransferase [Angustibacter luteus]|uniref:Class I SAM-dependent methyltransferase n=1 Tax=Angustibacter luteus TaxID=658456 RepID=A0ABW1JIQ0_9ACTN
MSAIHDDVRVPATPLTLTGERTAPGIWHEQYWFARHLAAYRYVAAEIVATRAALATDVATITLEAGCGEGYGLDELAAGGSRVVGLDYDAVTVRHAAATYGRDVLRGNVVRLPLADASVDAAVSLQVIEHIWTPHELVADLRRVLRPGGLLAVSTPNRLTFSPGLGRGERPTNAFHVREYDDEELARLVGAGFGPVQRLGVQRGPRLRALDARFASFPAAQLATPPERWPDDLADAVRAVRAEDFEIGPADDDALDLLVIAGQR